MDIIDQASDRELLDTQLAIEAARLDTRGQLKAAGACYNCLEPVESDRLFCDSDCRDDWALRKARGG